MSSLAAINPGEHIVTRAWSPIEWEVGNSRCCNRPDLGDRGVTGVLVGAGA